MKSIFACILLVSYVQFTAYRKLPINPENKLPVAGNLFIITLDGFRWQEIFNGADSVIINNEKYTPDTATMKMLYWSPDIEGRRKRLLPFFWNVIAAKGQLYGNRNYDNKVNTANAWSISYPGYNEIFTGNPDFIISSNEKKLNTNRNVLEYLNSTESFKGKVAAFTSWNVFPYILNRERSRIVLNSGYEKIDYNDNNAEQALINEVQEEAVPDKKATRHDLLTFLTAKEYLQQHQPRVLYLGLGETDEAAHDGRYDLYLEKAAEADRMIAQLWHFAQSTPGYKDNTTFIITTDHGRGKKPGTWTGHGAFVKGSSQTWLAVIGPDIKAVGEIKEDQQIYHEQLSQTIAALLGEKFESNHPVADAISLRQ